MIIDGRLRYLYGRRFCLTCSPFAAHNTSKTPPVIAQGPGFIEYRRRKRNEKAYRWQKRHRLNRKRKLVADRGGQCVDCGYSQCLAALDLHHRDGSSKEFGLGKFTGSLARFRAEAEKCDLLCANCHRLRHASLDDAAPPDRVVIHRRTRKLRAVRFMGSTCRSCDVAGPPSLFDFHHRDAAEKAFGVSDGIPRRWERVVAELAKCVMVCANCHREIHAGVRELEEGLLGLAEDAVRYVA